MSNFTTKSRTIELLGKKQIRDGVTALTELIKNAYDADAKTCRVIFNDYKNSNYILISDTGCGMTKKDILEKWLVIGTDSKFQKKRETPSGRVMMGEKGIGRLAASTLGNQLLMITKATDSNGWEIILIDWNTFNNKFASLDQISVGHLSNCAIKEAKDISTYINELLIPVKENLKKSFWFDDDKNNIQLKGELEELYSTIKKELNDYEVDYVKLYNQMQLIEKAGSGTLLYITNINDEWYKILGSAKESRKEIASNEYSWSNYNRLNTFIFNTNNSTKDFEIIVWCRDEIKEFSYGFTDEDYNNFDLKVKGKISKGIFTGEIKAINANEEKLNEANKILQNGLNVSPSDIEETTDCGEFFIEFMQIEGTEALSSLNADIWQAQVSKLALYGGISVYRDDVRILPYGEPRNDFLGIEERRTRGAGYYVFSHRRMYGRIDISRENNPLLEDKSNREGLIENRAYFYFVSTLQKLLIFLATDIINGLGLRESYTRFNDETKKAAELNDRIAKEQERLNKAYIKEIKERLGLLNKKIKNDHLKETFRIIEDALSNLNNNQDTKVLFQLDVINDAIIRAKNDINCITSEVISIDKKFAPVLDNELVISIYSVNEKLKEYCSRYSTMLRQFQNNLNEIRSAFEKTKSQSNEYISLIQNKCNDLIEIIQKEKKDSISRSIAKEHINKLLGYYNKTKIEIEQELNEINNNTASILNQKLSILNQTKSNVSNNIYNTEELFAIINNLSDLEDILDNTISSKLNKYEMVDSQYEYLQTLNSLFESDMPAGDYLEGLIAVNNSLRQENTILSELANVGLAAEVVDHEFNQYFTNVKYAINNLSTSIKDNNQKYWLNQIYVGFNAISNRHSQLSPTYRSKNLWKRDVLIRKTIDDLTDFFRIRLDRNNISVINEVDGEIAIYTSPSKLQPILSNLIDNSIYWLQSAKKKKIIWYFDVTKNALYIEDTGPGIPNYLREKIFELFFTTKPNNSGRGIGLYISKKLLNMDGFGISLVNGRIGDGACFEITFGGRVENE
ncbi:sensor histidine kinase [Sinanaerobacter chloroacetimidivorans]|uniref:histidine kinase n=1 Tax=Sinanaerobacter chloroacetimidivorans TaxID=2818044 RepID=A0A8J8B2C9_9FIRM|nr:sensor histidine kinase [Sinanaerobacter chloroacetimidivorans]MBR0598597.1 ATP-binding protein [Sinanaerobacter chloroacetimidivorans]